MTRPPKPWRRGGLTDGPPTSVHRSRNNPSFGCDQSIRTQPSGTDKAESIAVSESQPALLQRMEISLQGRISRLLCFAPGFGGALMARPNLLAQPFKHVRLGEKAPQVILLVQPRLG